ncbi:MAG: glycosyltransferase [Oscillibacter sp.]|nr:glycosyltransferase [Oscillibacter sp.]
MAEKTCIIIPCFNEADRFKREQYLSFLQQAPDIDFCFVNDGSRDDTLRVLRDIQAEQPSRIEVVDYRDNRGKAEAVRRGFLHVSEQGRYGMLAFADADLATPLEEIQRLVSILEEDPEVLIVMGSRIERMGVTIERKLYRHFTGRMFAALISLLFRLNAYDTQCGAKIFRANIVKAVFEEPFLSKWLFDVEILLRVRNRHSDYNRIVSEIPLNVWLEQGNSKIRFTHLLKMPFQLWKIYFRYRSRRKKEG